MKKKLYLLLSGMGMFGLFAFSSPAFAVDVLEPVCRDNPGADVCQSNTNQSTDSNAIYGPDGVLTKVANLIAVVVGIASVIMIIISGFKYITSSGDPSNIKSAKDTLMFAIVGIVITVSARAIVLFVLSRL